VENCSVPPETIAREVLENNLIDFQIRRADARREYQQADQDVRLAEAQLELYDFLKSVERTYGTEIAHQVRKYTTCPTGVGA
jgi:hypothetical protein